MVTRKPVGPPLATSPSKPNNQPLPYPISPVLDSAKTNASSNSNSIYSADLKTSPAFDLIDMNEARQRARSDSDASSHGTWDSDDTEHDKDDAGDDYVEVPKPLNIRSSQQDLTGKSQKEELPASLRVGPSEATKPTRLPESHKYEEEAQANPWASDTPERRQSNPNNPYLKQNGFSGESSQSAWQEVKPPPLPTAAPPPPPPQPMSPPPPPPSGPVELPTIKSPTEELQQMALDDARPASWETAEVLSVPQKGQSPLPPVTNHSERPVSTWWQDPQENQGESAFAPPVPPAKAPLPHGDTPVYQPPPGSPPVRTGTLIDHEDAPSRASRPVPAPIVTSQATSALSPESAPETPGTILKRQRNEHYQIKHINWYDVSSVGRPGLRNSPILTQNANGPCPLLALVNALVLSTPRDLDTALIETLRTREQVSLGLLLDAVFDELMSGRRGETAHELPDVSELYSFLLALHTGMNVNPRFVTPATTPRGSLDGHPPELSSMHPMHRAQHKAGAFEETKEMRLYSTFNIPLIHGWTPPIDTPAYEAFVRSAQTFEDAQNIQFAESELEDKLRSEGLTPQEQQTLQDIQTIKAFLNTWPTQLTDYGLETMSSSLKPGQIAILFRNDHFSTIYKEPKHGALMTLMTDAGYSTHDEIVWESLVDVNGAASEMFSGDFRVVSHGQDVRLNQGNSAGGEDGWQTVQSRSRYHGQHNSSSGGNRVTNIPISDAAPSLPGPRPQQPVSSPMVDGSHDSPMRTEAQRKAAEQEDHDLALALQLQEEEEDQQRQAEERRRREQELSEQFLSNESEGPRPPIPPRRNGGRAGGGPTTSTATTARPTTSTAPTARPPVNRPTDETDPDAPPSYEQAASDRPYRPAGSTAAAGLEQGNPLGAYDALRRQQSAYAQQSSSTINSTAGSTPPYTATAANSNRRRSDAARIRRRSSQAGVLSTATPSMIPGAYTPTSPSTQRINSSAAINSPGGPAPGHYPGSYTQRSPSTLRINQQATTKDAEDKCTIM